MHFLDVINKKGNSTHIGGFINDTDFNKICWIVTTKNTSPIEIELSSKPWQDVSYYYIIILPINGEYLPEKNKLIIKGIKFAQQSAVKLTYRPSYRP